MKTVLRKSIYFLIIFCLILTNNVFANGTTETKKTEDKVTLRLICSTEFENSSSALGDVNALIAKYKDIAPNINVEAEYVPWTELDNKLLLTNAGGNYYDIMLVNNSSLPVLAKAGILADVSKYVTRDNVNLEDIYTPAMAAGCKYNNGIYAFPFETDTRVLAVNMGMLKAAGITEPPKTKEDMIEVAKKVTKDLDGDGTIDQFGYPMNIARTLPCIYIQGNWLVANGLHLYEITDDNQYINKMDSPAGIDFFKWATEMGKYVPNDMISYDNSMISQSFASGKFAMFTYGAWMENDESFQANIKKNNIDMQLILNPSGSKGSSASTSGGWFLGTSPKSQHLEEAWQFLKFMMNPQVNAEVCTALPPIKATYDYPPYNSPSYNIFKQQLQTSETAVKAFIPEFNELVDLYGNNLIAAILGEKTPEMAAKDAAKAVNAKLKELGYQK